MCIILLIIHMYNIITTHICISIIKMERPAASALKIRTPDRAIAMQEGLPRAGRYTRSHDVYVISIVFRYATQCTCMLLVVLLLTLSLSVSLNVHTSRGLARCAHGNTSIRATCYHHARGATLATTRDREHTTADSETR